MRPTLDVKASVTEHMPVRTVTNPDGLVSVLHATTGREIFCSLPPDVENFGRPISSSSTGAIRGNRADVPELIRKAAEGTHCPMDDYPAHLEPPSRGPNDYLI